MIGHLEIQKKGGIAMEPLLSPDDVARILNVGRSKAYRLCRPGGPLRAIRLDGRVVRVTRAALAAYLQALEDAANAYA